MMLRFRCPHCGKGLAVLIRIAGLSWRFGSPLSPHFSGAPTPDHKFDVWDLLHTFDANPARACPRLVRFAL
jgi:hypothetical protein